MPNVPVPFPPNSSAPVLSPQQDIEGNQNQAIGQVLRDSVINQITICALTTATSALLSFILVEAVA